MKIKQNFVRTIVEIPENNAQLMLSVFGYARLHFNIIGRAWIPLMNMRSCSISEMVLSLFFNNF